VGARGTGRSSSAARDAERTRGLDSTSNALVQASVLGRHGPSPQARAVLQL
jgi:hypothetical protein